MGSISVLNLGKAFKQYPSRWARLCEWIDPKARSRHHLHWVLQNISFRVSPGEAVGIIGINGSGKSTLLKMITGTTQPSTGTVEISGRIAALLELGMGFHPDFTGRQNVFMAGQLLGRRIDEIAAELPRIEEFAEIGDYIDQPVRVYSSGMQMRLAFSAATAIRPDVLIVDEALSVGDAYFQHKSFDRIRDFRKKGTTLLIVSHDKQAIQSICDRAILLAAGRLAIQGPPEAVMDYYNASLATHQNQTVQQQPLKDGKMQTVSGTGEAIIERVLLLNENNEQIDVVGVGQPVRLQIGVRAMTDLAELTIGYMIKDRLGQVIFGTNTHYLQYQITNIKKGAAIAIHFDFQANLGEGHYSVAVALHESTTHIGKNYEWRDLALIFNVVNFVQPHFVGSAWLPPRFENEQ